VGQRVGMISIGHFTWEHPIRIHW